MSTEKKTHDIYYEYSEIYYFLEEEKILQEEILNKKISWQEFSEIILKSPPDIIDPKILNQILENKIKDEEYILYCINMFCDKNSHPIYSFDFLDYPSVLFGEERKLKGVDLLKKFTENINNINRYALESSSKLTMEERKIVDYCMKVQLLVSKNYIERLSIDPGYGESLLLIHEKFKEFSDDKLFTDISEFSIKYDEFYVHMMEFAKTQIVSGEINSEDYKEFIKDLRLYRGFVQTINRNIDKSIIKSPDLKTIYLEYKARQSQIAEELAASHTSSAHELSKFSVVQTGSPESSLYSSSAGSGGSSSSISFAPKVSDTSSAALSSAISEDQNTSASSSDSIVLSVSATDSSSLSSGRRVYFTGVDSVRELLIDFKTGDTEFGIDTREPTNFGYRGPRIKERVYSSSRLNR